MVDADYFISGHQPCDEGFRQANHRQIIIDGTNPYPAYCLFPTTAPVTIEALLKCVHIIDVTAPWPLQRATAPPLPLERPPEPAERRQDLRPESLLAVDDRDEVTDQAGGVRAEVGAGLPDPAGELHRRLVRRAGQLVLVRPGFERLEAVDHQVVGRELMVQPGVEGVGVRGERARRRLRGPASPLGSFAPSSPSRTRARPAATRARPGGASRKSRP